MSGPRWLRRGVDDLADLVLPTRCAGCDRTEEGALCRACTRDLDALLPGPAAPTPAPSGLPPCVAVGAYEGALRELVLGYKERGRHRLARPLGDQLARGVAASVLCAGWPAGSPVAVVPVPTTAAAIRARHGDHMTRLARRAVRRLNDGYCGGTRWPAVLVPALSARPRPDSSHLDTAARAAAASGAFVVRIGAARRLIAADRAGVRVIAVDDVLTTGATLAALARCLGAAGVPVSGAVTLAATRRRFPPIGPPAAASP